MPENATEPLLDPTLLVRVKFRAHQLDRKFALRPETLPDEAILPSLSAELAGEPKFAQVRMAIGTNALFFQLDVQGKKQLPWCRESRMEDSDGLHVWIDTRNSRDIHRATKYCYRLGLFAMGRGPKADLPFAGWAPINRARDNSQPPPDNLMVVRAAVQADRYRVVASVHFEALVGFDRQDFPVIGFYYGVQDRELGWQSLALQPTFPVAEDPSLWGQLQITG